MTRRFFLSGLLGLALILGAPASAVADFARTFTNRCYVDLEYGSDAADGLTRTTPYRTLKKVADVYLTPVGVGTPISLGVVVAGRSGGTLAGTSTINTGSTGWDQLSYDGTTRGTSIETSIGVRAWDESDGARPSSGRMVRPVLRSDTPFTSLTRHAATSVYYSEVFTVPSTVIGASQVLYKAGNNYTLTNLDSDGAWKSHFVVIGSGAATASDIATALTTTPLTAGYYNAYCKVLSATTVQIYVNLDTNGDATADLSTTAINYSWVPSQSVENFAKIKLQGFTYIEIDGIDTVFGERGIYIDGSLQTIVRNCRVYEPKVHGIACSYSTFALENILIENCEVYGLGSSSTGNTMISTTGASLSSDLTKVRIVNCKTVRYMLQNPAGQIYRWSVTNNTTALAQYPIFPLGIGTAASGSSGVVRQADVVGCSFLDVSPAKTSYAQGDILAATRCRVPDDRGNFLSYPIRFDRCMFDTYGVWLLSSSTADQADVAYALNDCKVLIRATAADAVAAFGVRTAFIFDIPTVTSDPAPVAIYFGIFGGTEFVVDIGTGDSGGNVMCGIGPKDVGSANKGLRAYFTARDSSLSIYSASQVIAPLFEQNSDLDVTDKILFVDVQRCTIAALTPIGKDDDKNQLIRRDTSTGTNTSRVFLNNRYVDFNSTNFSQSYATFAGFITNVDPYAKVGRLAPAKVADTAPRKVYTGLDRSTR